MNRILSLSKLRANELGAYELPGQYVLGRWGRREIPETLDFFLQYWIIFSMAELNVTMRF